MLSGRERYNGAMSTRPEYKIRDFQPEDFETLWRMDQECFPPGISYSRRELTAYMRRRAAFTLVALENAPNTAVNTIVGFIVAYGGNPGHVITIDVAPSARRSGIGSLLLRAVEARLSSAGSHAVGLETAVDNISALTFYKRHGYHVIRTWPRYYPNGVDALVMRKELSISA
jgi:ribosomal-protein-alanine N-acetyltransferase